LALKIPFVSHVHFTVVLNV